jgi:hypothetical protein
MPFPTQSISLALEAETANLLPQALSHARTERDSACD